MAELGSGDGSSYPGALDTDTNLEIDNTTTARADVPNDLGAAIIAVQTELGTDPAGTLTDVKTYLQTEHNTNGTHDNTLVALLAGSQTFTGAKSFTGGTDNSIRDIVRNLVVVNNSSNPAYQVDIDADEIMLSDSSDNMRGFTSINLTVDIATSGANGLDTGAEAADTWYYLWVIAKSDGTVAGLISASSTAPTMPSGYTFKALVGAARNDSSSDFLNFEQEGNKVFYDAKQTIKSGSFTTGAWTAQSITSFFPATAKIIRVLFANTVPASDKVGISPRSDGDAGDYAPIATGGTYGGLFPANTVGPATLKTRYEDSIYYFTNNAASQIYASGWEY